MAKRYKEPATKPLGFAKGWQPRSEAIKEVEETIRMLESGEMDPPYGRDMGPAYQGPEDEIALTRDEVLEGLRLRLEQLRTD
jgi:hypothetical protein